MKDRITFRVGRHLTEAHVVLRDERWRPDPEGEGPEAVWVLRLQDRLVAVLHSIAVLQLVF